MTQAEQRSNNAKEDRVRRLYRRQLEGLSARALVYDHAEKEQVSMFNQALKKGQLQTASQVLDSLGRVIGESTETVNIQAPDLTITIQNKDDW